MTDAPTGPMATMLDLPREMYLMVCSDLSTNDLACLAGVSRDHYLAVQAPLFSSIHITSFTALVKLVGTLMKTPVVSHISPRQRLLWHRLSNAQLRERDIRYLDLNLIAKKDPPPISGAVLAQFISAISRKCEDVKISLTFRGLSAKLMKELKDVSLPNVRKLTLFMGKLEEEYEGPRRRRTDQPDSRKMAVWPFSFAGSTFPDLQSVYMNSLMERSAEVPSNMEDGFRFAQAARPRRRWADSDLTSWSVKEPLYGLLGMKEISLEYNTYLDADVLNSLFNSAIVPKNLTKLEIVQCPALHPIQDMNALATLLRRGLKLLQFLKLHLTPHFDGHHGYEHAYISKIDEMPHFHLCNIVRELGPKIKGLDLAIPFACDHMFVPIPKTKQKPENISELDLPDIPETPVNTLPQRLMDAGYRYRRLIFNGYCRGVEQWDTMANLARCQGDKISWELLCDGEEPRALWLVSGCASVEFSVQGAMQHPFDA